jgi:hypothetical protein
MGARCSSGFGGRARLRIKICAMLVPREMQVEHSGGVKAMSDEEIERAIEMIEALIA